MSRRWWLETGGYDTQMMGWGGENIDQSLRTWLCGGEIVSAQDSHVAHMWRTKDPKTKARYWNVGDASVNRARAVHAWFGEFTQKLEHFPVFSSRRSWGDSPWYGNVSSTLLVKKRMKCRPFAWFLRRFKALYEDGGMIPQEVFMLREMATGSCLRYDGRAGTSFDVQSTASLATCAADNDRMYWHLGNRDPQTGRCCNGLRAWNTDQCLGRVAASGHFTTSVCSVVGSNLLQEWSLSDAGELRHSQDCVSSEGGRLLTQPCEAPGRVATLWAKVSATVPIEGKLYEKARSTHPLSFASADKQLAQASA